MSRNFFGNKKVIKEDLYTKKSVKKTAKHSVKENRFLTKVVRGFKNIMVSPFDK
ncbi:MAG: hypothetical protein H8E03_00305 [Pelagibacteraceae bacterium]|nr:hypothetical protein [Pelagibacteraceae bacterium]